MTHHEGHDAYHTGPSAHTTPPGGGDEWREVKRSLEQLGDSMTRWANAVKDDPENRRHAQEMKEQFERMGNDIGRALDSAADSDFVKDLGSAAGKAGEAFTDAAKTVGREVTPFVATAFRTAAEGIRVVADKIEETSAQRRSRHAGHEPASSHQAASEQPVTPPAAGETPPPPATSAASPPAAAPATPPPGAEPPGPAPSGIRTPSPASTEPPSGNQ